ncbi:MAG: transglutaminase domain-containing protein [Candidatus Xenobiia bacterium LiM19]
MKKTVIAIIALLLVTCSALSAAEIKDRSVDTIVKEAGEAKKANNYTKAITLLDEARKIYKKQGTVERFEALTIDINAMVKVLMEYTLSESDLYNTLEKKKLPLTREEVKKLIDSNSLDYMMIDGKKKYFTSCLSNSIYRDPSRLKRWKPFVEASRKFIQNSGWLIYNNFADPDIKPYTPYHSPQVFLGKAELKIMKEHLPSKGVLKLWIPFPVTTGSQTDVRLLSVSPEASVVSLPDRDADIGALYMELPLPLKKKEVKIRYIFKQYAVRFAIDPGKVGAYDRQSELYRHNTRSDSNCTITPEIKALAEKIVSGEKNPYLAAKKIYDHVVYKVKYGYMPHLTLGINGKSESVYVYDTNRGDCGAQSLFYSALCRAAGIPSRCLGGMQLSPGMNSYHFWAETYIPGFGWIPVDTSIAQMALDDDSFSQADRKKYVDFYFGSIDPYRLYLQKETDLEFYPPMKTPRFLKLAFQMPDAECEGCEAFLPLLIEYKTEFERVE